MAKDVKDYIQRCLACRQEKAQVQSYPLHMMEIRDRPFNKIAMDLVTDFTESNKGNKHILTIIDLPMGWPEAILIPNKSADTITKEFIRHYLPRHLCPRFILSDNGTEFKNQTFDRVTKDLGIERIFSAPYHPQSNGKLETFHKFLKPTPRKMCAEDQDNWHDYVEQVLGTYRGVPNLTTGESPFFLVYGKDGNQPLHQLLQPLTRFLGNPDSGLLCLDQHRPSLSIAKKYLDDHRFLNAEKMTEQNQDSKEETEFISKTKPQENGTSNGQQNTESSRLSAKDATCTSKTKLQEKSDPVMLRTLSLNQSVNYGM